MWKSQPPVAPGLYIASTDRRADYVRAWTGKHWTPPLHVRDLNLTERVPSINGPKAHTDRGRAIEWLEPVAIDADGFISWSALQDAPPVPPDTLVDVRLRSGGRSYWPVRAGGFRWGDEGPVVTPAAYRVAVHP